MPNTPPCKTGEPLIKLAEGQIAPVLDYSLPQDSSFTAYGRVAMRLEKEKEYFTPKALELPVKIIDFIKNATIRNLAQDITSGSGFGMVGVGTGYWGGGGKGKFLASESTNDSVINMGRSANPNTTTTPTTTTTTNPETERLAELIKSGYAVQITEGMNGYNQKLKLLKRPFRETKDAQGNTIVEFIAKPQIYFVEEYTTTSFVGDYGAGKALSTMSLLPGEKTTITIKTFKEDKMVKSASENVIDSMSKDSASELEKAVEEETASQSSQSTDFSLSASVSFKAFGASGSVNSSFGMKSARSNNQKNINKALNKTVDKSNASRQITINSSTQETSTQSEEVTTVRNIQNINQSRVLNIAYRELLQEYDTITYLNDVKIGFTNGHPEMDVIMNLEELDTYLELFVLPAKQEEIRKRILFEYTQMENFRLNQKIGEEQKLVNFLEEVPYKTYEGQDRTYIQKHTGINSPYTTVKNRTYNIKGLILNATHYTLRTPALIADAMLGYGEALDCYAMKLMDNDIEKARIEREKQDLENQRMSLMLRTLSEINDPKERAEALAKLFNPPIKTT